MKIAVITCYHDPDYVRARTIRAALASLPGVEMTVVKNEHRGVLRYAEVLWRLWRVRRSVQPDAYFITFRGYEILPFALLIAGKKPVIFDEFIIPVLHAKNEHHKRSVRITVVHTISRLSEPLYRHWLVRCHSILADTQAHAELSARTSHMNIRKYLALPVGTDEQTFAPKPTKLAKPFRVFYYTTGMQPLHGIPTVLDAALLLKDNRQIQFLLVGGKGPMQRAVGKAKEAGANITYEPWIPFTKLASTMRASGLNLGGPFGNTQQAQHVITGKSYQSLACAVPTLVGAGLATSEYFVDKHNSLVVPQADVVALAEAITWASTHSRELAVIGLEGRKLFDAQFSTAALARRLQPLVDSLS